MDSGEVVTESVVVAQRIATEFASHTDLLPALEKPAIDDFVELWTRRVEPAYYGVLAAPSESQARFATVALLDGLIEVENALWQRAMQGS